MDNFAVWNHLKQLRIRKYKHAALKRLKMRVYSNTVFDVKHKLTGKWYKISLSFLHSGTLDISGNIK
jgi:hypothetical protein